MLTDSLAVHSIGGFKVGVGFALRICRTVLPQNQLQLTMYSTAHR